MSNRLYNAAIFNEVVYRPLKLMTKPVAVIAGILLAALLLASTFSVSAQTDEKRIGTTRTARPPLQPSRRTGPSHGQWAE